MSMNTSPKPDYDRLVHKFLKLYFSSTSRIEKMNLGNANANYVVSNDGERYFFRIYLTQTNFPVGKKELDTEIKLVMWFHKKGFPVAESLENKEGMFISNVGDYFGALFKFLVGKHMYGKLNEQQFASVGRLMADVHIETQSENLTCSKRWREGNFWKAVEKKVSTTSYILNNEEKQIYDTIFSKINLLEQTPQYWIHGDFHFANLLFNEKNEITAWLDFDAYKMGHFMDDAVRFFVSDLSYTSQKYYNLEHAYIEQFWKSYVSNRHLDKKELALIPLYIELHYLWQFLRLKKEQPEKVDSFNTAMVEFRNSMTKVVHFLEKSSQHRP